MKPNTCGLVRVMNAARSLLICAFAILCFLDVAFEDRVNFFVIRDVGF
jgi:hypothetical protein